MVKFPIAQVVNAVPSTVANIVAANEGTILPVGSIVFSGVAIVAAVKNSNDILSIIGYANDALNLEADPETRKKIYISAAKDLAPKVGPIVIFYGASVACTIVNKKHTDKKIAELTAAIGLAQNAITQYQLWQKQAEKELGEKVKTVNQAVAEKQEERHPMNPPMYTAANEDYFYYDIVGNRYFHSTKSPTEIENFCKEASYDLCDGNVDGDRVTYNDIYDFIGKDLGTMGGNEFGWLAEMSRGRRRSDIINVRISPTEMTDHKTLVWQLDLCGAPLFRTRY